MTAAELAIIIKARDETKGVFDQIKSKTDSLGSKLGSALKMGGLAAAGGIGIAAIALKGFVQDAAEAQKVQAQTNAVIASTKGVAGVSAKAVSDLANELSRVIPIDDELIASTQNMLLTFTQVGKEVFPQATEAALDMAVALGEDPVDAAMRLGKALNDPIRGVTALRRVGVQLTAEQEKQVRAFMAVNDIAGAQKVILGELATEFGNSGRAAGETFAGKMKILQTQIGNVKETIGNALIPILTLGATYLANFVADHQDDIERFAQLFSQKVLVAIQGVVDFMTEHKETIKKFFESFKTGLEALRPVVEYILTNKIPLIAAILAVGVAIAFALGPVSAAALAIIGIITLIGYLKDNWRDVLKSMQRNMDELMIAAGIALGPLGLPLLIAGISRNGFGLRDDMKLVVDEIVGFFAGLPGRLAGIGEGIAGAIGNGFRAAWDEIAQTINDAIPNKIAIKFGPDIPLPPNPLPLLGSGTTTSGGYSFGNRPSTAGQMGGGGGIGGAGAVTMPITVNVNADTTDATIQKIARAVEEGANAGLRRTGLQGVIVGAGMGP